MKFICIITAHFLNFLVAGVGVSCRKRTYSSRFCQKQGIIPLGFVKNMVIIPLYDPKNLRNAL